MYDDDDARVGFLGKIPAQPDFVRQNLGQRIGGEFDQWLVKSIQNLNQAKLTVPVGLRFVFCAPDCDTVAVGVMTPSHDQVGRSFPLAIYTSCTRAEAAREFMAIPLAFAQFFAQADAVLEQLETLSLEALREHVVHIKGPTSYALGNAAQRCREVLAQERASDMLARAFAGSPQDSELYGLHTFRTAVEAVQTGPGTGAPTVLACPIAVDVDLFAWLDLARRSLPWKGSSPAFAWVEDPQPRLLLSLGFASDQLLHFASDPAHGSARLWPLTTTRMEAITRARDELGPIASSAQNSSIDELWTLLARGAR